QAAIAWLETAFRFETLMNVPGLAPGTSAHAELRLGDGVIMLGSEREDADHHPWKSPRSLPGVNQLLYIVVYEVDAHYERAKAAGAEIVMAPRDEDYGGRDYVAKDPEGHYWS